MIAGKGRGGSADTGGGEPGGYSYGYSSPEFDR
jgi:hypothetical protein